MQPELQANFGSGQADVGAEMRNACPLVALVVALALPLPAAADYDLGLVAFDRGDIATAHREFSVLAQQGHRAAQYNLAMLYLKGEPPDYAKAKPWLEKSARQGLAQAQYMLGMLAVYGVGMARDKKQGLQWLQLASDQGSEEAYALLEDLQKASLREAQDERRKKEQARNLRAEIEKAKASEQALQKQLAQSKAREKKLKSERQSLQKARESHEQVAERMRRERDQLASELAALRAELRESERSLAAVEKPSPEPKLVDEPPGESVISGKILEILPEGVLLTEVSRRGEGQSEFVPTQFVVFVNLLATNGLTQGQDVAFVAEPTAPYRYKDQSGATGPVRAYRATGTWHSN